MLLVIFFFVLLIVIEVLFLFLVLVSSTPFLNLLTSLNSRVKRDER